MDFTIYTTGSAEFLEMMLNSSAMITGSGTSDDLARIGMMIGLLLLAFQAVFNGQGISFQKAGLLFVLYLVFYGPTATTVIQDTTNAQVRVVDNVPIGPAFVGSVISTVAYEITRVGEQAWSTPKMTDYGLFSSLTTLARVRDALRNPMALDGFQNYRRAEGWDLPKTFNEFMTFCTLNPIALREFKDIDQLYRSPSAVEMIAAPLASQFVYVYDGTSGGSMKSCSEAQTFLSAVIPDVYQDVLDDILNKGFANEKAAGRMTDGSMVQAAADDALQNLALSNKVAQEYVLTSLISPMFNDARVDALNHWQEQRAAMALRESLNQQELQWAGKGDTFKHYMRPMIAFFEGLLYAMTPFMAFALVLGGPGISILGKYLVLPLAVGLWMPLLSIVNAFTLWYAGNQMQSIFDGYDPTASGFAMLQVLEMDQAIGKALGIGGLLAASVPPLALFIVSGSAMGLNSIMGQMTQGDKFKSEDITPRSQQPQPVMASNAMFTSDQLSAGVSKTGATLVAEQISAKQAASALVQSTETASKTATETYQKNLASAVEQSATTSEGRQNLANLGHQVSSSLNLSSNSQFTNASATLRGLGFSQDSIAASAFAASVGASAPFGLAGTKLEDSQQFKEMSSERQEQTRQALTQLTSAVQASSNDQTLFNSGDAFTSSSQSSLTQKASETLSKSSGEAKQAQLAYARASSMEDVYGAGQSLDLKQAANNALGKGSSREEAAQQLAELAGSTASGRAAFDQAFKSESIQGLSTDRNERVAMAAIRALNQDGRLGDLVGSELTPFDFNVKAGDANSNADLAGQVPGTSGLAGQSNPPHGAYTEAMSLAGQVPGASGLESQFHAAYGVAHSAYASERDMNLSGLEGIKADGPVVVASEVDAANNRVREENDMNTSRMDARQQDAPLPTVDVSLESSSTLLDTTSNFAQQPITSVGNGVGQLIEGAGKIAGVEENSIFQTARNAISSPIQTAKTGAQQIVDGIGSIVSPEKREPPPKI